MLCTPTRSKINPNPELKAPPPVPPPSQPFSAIKQIGLSYTAKDRFYHYAGYDRRRAFLNQSIHYCLLSLCRSIFANTFYAVSNQRMSQFHQKAFFPQHPQSFKYMCQISLRPPLCKTHFTP